MPARRRWLVPAAVGLGLGWLLGLLGGALLDGELQALRVLFLPLSALAGGLAAAGAWTHFGSLADTARELVRRRCVRAVFAGLALGLALLAGLYTGFAVRVGYAGSSRSVPS